METYASLLPGFIRRVRLCQALLIHGLRTGRFMILLCCLLTWGSFMTAQEYPLITSATIASDVSTTVNSSSKRGNNPKDLNVNAPDYVVSSFEGPSSALPGESISLSVNVFNQGGPRTDGRGGGLDFVWLSNQPTLGGSLQEELARRITPRLAAGEVDIVFLNVSIPPDLPGGTYYLIYQTDRADIVDESNENNNLASFPITIEGLTQPDYISEALNAPATAVLGEDFTLSATIRNIGDGPGDGAGGQEDFWLADQPNFSGSVNEFLGRIPTPSLAPNEAIQLEKTFTIPENLTPGTYHIIHVVEQDDVIEESNENNNRGTRQIEITNLSLCDVALPLQHLVKTEGNFTNATNQISSYGRGGNYPGREAVYRIDLPPSIWLGGNVYFDLKGDAEKLILLNSCDPTDVYTGPFIDPGTAQLITGAGQGTYYIVVEGPSNGSDGNFELTVRRDHLRCSDARSINLGEATAPGPFSPYTYANQYCGDPNATPLLGDEAIYEVNWPGGDFRAVLSDMTINAALPLEDAAMILLSDCEDPATCVMPPVINNGASELVMEQENLAAGTYFVVVDGVSGGFNLDFRLTISEMEEPKPDFTVTAASVDTDPIIPGEAFNLTYTIANLGNDDGGAFWIRNFFSTDATYDGTDEQITGGFTFRLDAGGNRTFENGSRTLPEGTAPGNYYFIIAIDSDDDNDESDETNNTFAIPITVESNAPPLPDFTITDMSVDTDPIIPGEGFRVTFTIANFGEVDYAVGSSSSTMKFYFSTNNTLDGADRELEPGGNLPTQSLEAGQSRSFSLPNRLIPAGTPAGDYYLIMRVDDNDAIEESDETNNTFALPISVGSPTPQFPDYQPTNFRARGGSNIVQAGGSLIIDLNIENKGTVDGQGNGGKDEYYLNTTPDLNGSPVFLRDFGTADIPANSLFEVNSGPLTIPASTPPGTYYIVFFHDADEQITESDESNNLAWLEITVLEPGSGLDISFTVSDNSICQGESVQFTSTVSSNANSLTTLYDFSGNGNHGSMRNFDGTPYTDHAGFGKALTFDNTQDHVECGNILPISYTKEVWINRTDGAGNLISGGPPNGDAFWLSGNYVYAGQTGDFRRVRDPNPVSEGWQHYAVTYDEASRTMKLYRNGVEVASNTDVPPAAAPNGNVGLGHYTNVNYYGGQMDEVRIWEGARTPAQIQASYNQELSGSEAGLVAYYKFSPSSADATYNWSIERDGQSFFTSSDPNASFTFNEPGRYRVSLTVTSEGQTNTEVQFILVEDCTTAPFSVDFTADPTDPCLGQEVQFTAQVDVGIGASQLIDVSGNGNDGELKNFSESPFETSGYGQSLPFDGLDDHVELPENLTANLDQFTFEAWHFFEGPTHWQRIMDFGAGIGKYIFLTPSNGIDLKPRAAIKNGGGEERLNSPDALTPGQWFHYALVIDGRSTSNNARLYINGVLKDQQTFTLKPSDLGNTDQNWLGRSQWSDPYLTGKLEEVRVWSTARTEQQIQANMQRELSGAEDGLLVYYNFNQVNPDDLTYSWAFSGGTPATSSEANPTVTYSVPGPVDVSLRVTSGGRSATETKSSYLSVQACEPDWPVTETGDNHTVFVEADASILLNSLPTASAIAVGDYVGAFYYQDNQLFCAGKAQWTGENLAIIVYGDDLTTPDTKEGFGTGESFQWKIWKAATNQEFFGLPTYALPAGIITHTGQFAPDGVSQLIEMTGEISPVRNETQTIGLLPGWNMISSIIKANEGNMADIFAPIASRIAIVKNGDGEVYVPSMSLNDIGNWNVVDGYQVRLLGDSPLTFSLVGQPVDPESTPIPLDAGYNLIAYLPTNAAPAPEVMAPIQDELEILKNGSGQVYIPSLGINNVGSMRPGEGYKVKVSQATTLTFTANRLAAPATALHMARLNPQRYQLARRGGPNATLILKTQGLVDYGDEIGVFNTEGRLVGAATFEDHVLAFPIWGDDPTTDAVDGLAEGASFELRVWNKSTNTEAVMAFSANTDRFSTDGVIEAELLRSTSLASALEANRIQLFPNPTRGAATLSLSLKQNAQVEAVIYDLAGKQLLSITNETLAAGSHELSFQTAQLPAGLYHCRIVVDGEMINLPFSVLK